MNRDNRLQFGDVILINFPFTDFSEYKKRPCLVLKENRDDILVCFISSRIDKREKDDLIIKMDAVNKLKQDSILKVWKINTVHKAMFDRVLGRLSDSDIAEVKKYLLALIRSI